MEFSHKNNGEGFSVRDKKIELRLVYRERRRALSPEQKAALDADISRRLLSLAGFRYADAVLSYIPLPEEVDITPVNEAALESGKLLALPRCLPGTPTMEFRTVASLTALNRGQFSIMEPDERCPLWQYGDSRNVICIVPALAYDLSGFRLGYGKGYYDRYLSSKEITKVGVVYNSFITKNLPRGRYDLSVDLIVTDKGIITPR